MCAGPGWAPVSPSLCCPRCLGRTAWPGGIRGLASAHGPVLATVYQVRLKVVHRTDYRYETPVRRVVQTLRLTPRSSTRQTVLEWFVDGNGSVHAEVDPWGNVTHLHTVDHRTRRVHAEAWGEVETSAEATWCDERGPAPGWYRGPTALIGQWPAIVDLAHACVPDASAGPSLGSPAGRRQLLRMAHAVARRVQYLPGHTDVQTRAETAWQSAAGVCQDQAQVYIAACRAADIPARYVSGYFLSRSAAGQADTESLASHAWAEVCIDVPQRRWLGIDVTHGCPVDERHIAVAVGPDYAACPPVRGVRSGGGAEVMTVQLHIRAA